MCRHQISEPIHKVTGFVCASKISAAVRVIDCSACLAIFRHRGGLREPQKVSLNLSLKLCHPFFPLFPTELIRSQLFSCSGVKFLSVPLNQPHPLAPSKITNAGLRSADYCDILIKSGLKGRSHCYHINPHRSFTLFKQIRWGLYPFSKIQLLLHKRGIVIAWITGMGIFCCAFINKVTWYSSVTRKKLGNEYLIAADSQRL